MSTPRDGDHQDGAFGDGSGWQEPAHLGGDDAGRTDGPPPDRPADAWEPPGWNLPPATNDRASRPEPAPEPESQSEQQAPARQEPTDRQGRGPGRGQARGELDKVFGYQGDVVGAQGWALQHGWTISDGSGPEDAVLNDLIASAPVRTGKENRAAGVLRGRAGPLELVAFDLVYASGRYLVPQYAVTAAPLLGTVPGLRLSPARFWKHRTGGLVPITSGNEAFDSRWLLLAAEDTPQVRRLVQDPAVQGLLLGTDDGDEFWTGAGHVAALRPDGHRPQLIEHHARLLTAIVAALALGY